MNTEAYKKFLLANIPTAIEVAGGTHIACRCFYCPDGKSSNTRHFYISIPQNPSEPSMYYCHKCHASGIVTTKTLIQWGIYDTSIGTDLINHNKNIKVTNSNTTLHKVYNIKNDYITDNDISQYKLQYINGRLGTSLTYDDCKQLKIVLNLEDLLNSNHISYRSRADSIIEQLNYNFLGFLSTDNSFLNMRRLCKDGKVYPTIDKRYINYKIFSDAGERFYTIPMMLNLDTPNRIKIHIAEGPFDILSVYLNLRNKESGIYSSIAGSNYLKTALYFIQNFGLSYIELHFYPDNDETGNKAINGIEEYFKPIGIPVYIHRNIFDGNYYTGNKGMIYEKDFGVNLDHIRESIMQVC